MVLIEIKQNNCPGHRLAGAVSLSRSPLRHRPNLLNKFYPIWDGGQNGDGKTSTANFISGMMKSVPPLDEVFTMAGMQLPTMLGKKADGQAPAAEEAKEN